MRGTRRIHADPDVIDGMTTLVYFAVVVAVAVAVVQILRESESGNIERWPARDRWVMMYQWHLSAGDTDQREEES